MRAPGASAASAESDGPLPSLFTMKCAVPPCRQASDAASLASTSATMRSSDVAADEPFAAEAVLFAASKRTAVARKRTGRSLRPPMMLRTALVISLSLGEALGLALVVAPPLRDLDDPADGNVAAL